MTNNDITNLKPEDFHTSVAATSRAFWPDPMFGFFSRNAVHEHLMLPNYATAVMRDAVKHGIVEVIIRNGRVVASASWLAPGDAPRWHASPCRRDRDAAIARTLYHACS